MKYLAIVTLLITSLGAPAVGAQELMQLEPTTRYQLMQEQLAQAPAGPQPNPLFIHTGNNRAVAWGYSTLVPGAGQLYNQDWIGAAIYGGLMLLNGVWALTGESCYPSGFGGVSCYNPNFTLGILLHSGLALVSGLHALFQTTENQPIAVP